MDFQVLGHVAVPRLYRRHFFFSFVPTDLKVRGYSPSALRLVRRLVLYVIFDSWADLICALCLMFSFWFVFCCFANGQWLTANGCCFVVRNNTAKIRHYFDYQNKNQIIFANLSIFIQNIAFRGFIPHFLLRKEKFFSFPRRKFPLGWEGKGEYWGCKENSGFYGQEWRFMTSQKGSFVCFKCRGKAEMHIENAVLCRFLCPESHLFHALFCPSQKGVGVRSRGFHPSRAGFRASKPLFRASETRK